MDFFGRDGSIFWPVVLILVGSVLLMIQMGTIPAAIIAYWPVLLIVVGLMGLSNLMGSPKTVSKSKKKKK